jgi:hypothetical protein
MFIPLPIRPPVFDSKICLRHAIRRLEVCVEVTPYRPSHYHHGHMENRPEIRKLRGKLHVFAALSQYGFDNLQVLTLNLSTRAGTWLWGRYPGHVGDALLHQDEVIRRREFLRILVDSLKRVGPVKTTEFRFRISSAVDDEARTTIERALQIR